MEFKEFGLCEPVLESLQRLGFTIPTPIQEQAIPPLLQGRDLMGRAETGSGKTLAFGLPLVDRVEAARVSIQALIICPTRELAQQVADDIADAGKEKGIKVALVVGGVHVRTQRLQIPGKQVVVGTPGRIIDLLTDRFLPVEWVEYFVLDEFDRLLDMGFLDDIKKIVKRLPKEKQTALFSATVPKMIVQEAHKLLNNPVHIEIGSARRAVDTITQRAIRTSSSRKLAIVEHILKDELENDGSVVIFCNTKKAVRLVDRELWAKNLSVAALSGDHEQSVRFKVMERFRNREIRVLVATDVAARGLDIDHIGHVINFDTPFETEDYVHRIGRTGRAGRDGVVTTLIGNDDFQKFERIRKHIEQDIEMLSEKCEPLKDNKKQRPSSSHRSESRPEQKRDEKPQDSNAPTANAQDSNSDTQAPEQEPRGRKRRRRPQSERTEESRPNTPGGEAPSAASSDNSDNDEQAVRKSTRRRSRGRGRGRQDERPSQDENSPTERSDSDSRDESNKREERSEGRSRGRGRQRRRGNEDDRPRQESQERPQEQPRESSDEKESRGRGGRRRQSGQGERTRQEQAPRESENNKEDRSEGDSNGRSRRSRRPRNGNQQRGESQNSSTDSTRGAERNARQESQESRPQNDRGQSRNDSAERSSTRGARQDQGNQSRGRKSPGRNDDRKEGRRRSQSDHERWERQQLDRPVDLIEDNWNSVDNFAKESDKRERGEFQANDNAPAPFDDSSKDRASHAGFTKKKTTPRRSQRPQGDQRPSGDDKKSKEAPKPEKKDNDIVW